MNWAVGITDRSRGVRNLDGLRRFALAPADFDAKSQAYYAKVRSSIEATSYERLRGQFRRFPDTGPVSDAELKTRLADMYANYGRDDRTSPQAFLASGLPAAYLIAELTRVRERTFYRLSDEALTDVKITNALINTLRYKGR